MCVDLVVAHLEDVDTLWGMPDMIKVHQPGSLHTSPPKGVCWAELHQKRTSQPPYLAAHQRGNRYQPAVITKRLHLQVPAKSQLLLWCEAVLCQRFASCDVLVLGQGKKIVGTGPAVSGRMRRAQALAGVPGAVHRRRPRRGRAPGMLAAGAGRAGARARLCLQRAVRTQIQP